MISRSNILISAMAMIGKSDISLYRYASKTTNDVGEYILTYSQPVIIAAAINPVSKVVYEQFGLDFQKEYIRIYTPNVIGVLKKNEAGDIVKLQNGKFYCAESNVDWYDYGEFQSVFMSFTGMDEPVIA